MKKSQEINPAVYILGNNRPTLYTGITNDLIRRLLEHFYCPKGFVKEYGLDKLLYYEWFDEPWQAIVREKQIKDMDREPKLALIRENNPRLEDKREEIFSLVNGLEDYHFYNEKGNLITLELILGKTE